MCATFLDTWLSVGQCFKICIKQKRELFWLGFFPFFHMMCVSVVTTLPAFVTMVTVSSSLALPAALPASAQRHQWGSCHSNGQHSLHWRCCHDGSTSPIGGWRLTSLFCNQTTIGPLSSWSVTCVLLLICVAVDWTFMSWWGYISLVSAKRNV